LLKGFKKYADFAKIKENKATNLQINYKLLQICSHLYNICIFGDGGNNLVGD
jgi:hypothetical protein